MWVAVGFGSELEPGTDSEARAGSMAARNRLQ